MFQAGATVQMMQGLAIGALVECLRPSHPAQASGCADEASCRCSQHQDRGQNLQVSRRVASRGVDGAPESSFISLSKLISLLIGSTLKPNINCYCSSIMLTIFQHSQSKLFLGGMFTSLLLRFVST